MTPGVFQWLAGLFGGRPPYPTIGGGRRSVVWRGVGNAGPNAVVAASTPALRSQCRQLYRENPTFRRVVDLRVTHVAGSGFGVSSACSDPGFRADFARAWEAWTPFAGADGESLGDLTRVAATETATAGEVFGRLLTVEPTLEVPVPLRLKLLESEQLPFEHSLPIRTGEIVQGIELDPNGARTGYWFWTRHPGDPTPGSFIADL